MYLHTVRNRMLDQTEWFELSGVAAGVGAEAAQPGGLQLPPTRQEAQACQTQVFFSMKWIRMDCIRILKF